MSLNKEKVIGGEGMTTDAKMSEPPMTISRSATNSFGFNEGHF